MKLSKRGVSAVVATVLIVLITIAAVGILWAAISPLISKGLDESKVCYDATTDVSIGSDGACITSNASGNFISVQIQRGTNTQVNLSGVQVIASKGGNS